MEYFTARNTAILALTQVGVIVAGVLGAGAAHKWYVTVGLLPWPWTNLVASWGFVALFLPIVWATLALWLLIRGEDHEVARLATFYSGFLVVLLLLFFVAQSSAWPLLRLLTPCGGLSAVGTV